MGIETPVGGFARSPLEALNPPATSGCCGSLSVTETSADTASPGGCCGTDAVVVAENCCGVAATAEPAAAGGGCCG